MATLDDKIDILRDASGDIVVTDDLQLSSGYEGIRQSVETRLKNIAGEWFLDLNSGVPYLNDEDAGIIGILGNKYDEERARSVFRDVILSTPGVSDLTTLTLSFVGESRTLTVTFEARVGTVNIGASVAIPL